MSLKKLLDFFDQDMLQGQRVVSWDLAPYEAGLPRVNPLYTCLLVSTYELGHQPSGLAEPAAILRQIGAVVETLDLAVEGLDEESGLMAIEHFQRDKRVEEIARRTIVQAEPARQIGKIGRALGKLRE